MPDPTIVAKLENSYEEIRRLREQISELQQENVNQSSQISQMNEELSKQRERIDELEREVAMLKAAAVGVAAAGANSAVRTPHTLVSLPVIDMTPILVLYWFLISKILIIMHAP